VPVSAESTTPTAAPTDDPSAKPKKAKTVKGADQSTLFGDEE
jgi:hypothetical protein